MTRTDRIMELATAILAARAEVRLEGELEELAGGGPTSRIRSRGTSTRPGRRSRKEEPSATPPPESADGGAARPPKATGNGPGKYPRPTDARNERIVTLAATGQSAADIAAELGIATRLVELVVYRARKAGRLPSPKAVASR